MTKKRAPNKPKRRKAYMPWMSDIYRAAAAAVVLGAVYSIMTEYMPTENLHNFALGGAGALSAFLMWTFLRRAWFRMRGKTVERLNFLRLKLISPGWTVKSSVMLPPPYRSDTDIFIKRWRKSAAVEVKSAQSDWGLMSEDPFRWNAKALSALQQATKCGKALKAKPVLWLPLCKKKFCAHRNGVLVIGGGAFYFKRMLKRNW